LLQVLLFSPNPLFGLLWPSLLAALSLSALFGSRRAATTLKFVFYVMAVASLLLLVVKASSLLVVARTVVFAVLLLVTARYLASSKGVAQFYAARSPAPPSVG